MIAAWFVSVLAFYALLGAVFAFWFVASGVDRFDPAARGASRAFRALLFPGTAALWPVLLVKWIKRGHHD